MAIVREETKLQAMRIELGRRALKFEEKIRTLFNELFKKCLVEIEKDKQNRTRSEVERGIYFRRYGRGEK